MKNKVLIIGADHYNTLGLIESFAEKGLLPYVIIITLDNWAYVLKSKYITKSWICHSDQDVITCMLDNFSNELDKVVVIASCDHAASIIDDNYEKLIKYFILPITDTPGNFRTIINKENMSSLARKVGINVPKTWVISNKSVPNDVNFPCITKAISSVEGSKKNIKVFYIKSDLMMFLNDDNHCSIIQVEEFIDKEYEFQLLGCSLNHGKEIIIPGRTHMFKDKFGLAYFLRFDIIEEEYEELVIKAKELIGLTGYQGLFSIEMLRGKDGKTYFTEMNLRNDGTAYCATSSGINLPYIYYLNCIGKNCQQEINNSSVRTTYMITAYHYFIAVLTGRYSIKEWFLDVRKATCHKIYFRNDRKPVLWFILKKCEHLIKRIL